jgi:LuxR family maltose regulon positive regulatory protein
VRLAEGRFDGVNGLLERLLALAERQERRESMIEILLTQALAYQAQSERRNALDALESALALAQPEGFLRTFVDEGEALHSLLLSYRSGNENQAHPALRDYADEILAAFAQPGEISSQARRTAQAPALIEPLTDRELEILRLIAKGKSNAEISQRLYLALSTVKGHNLRIFHKLQVQNRTEAVSRARELGLL